MRLAVLIAKDRKGKWHTLALPETPIQVQKERLKAMKIACGVDGEGKDAVAYEQDIILTSTGQTKRAKFFKPIEDVALKNARLKVQATAKAVETAKAEAEEAAEAAKKASAEAEEAATLAEEQGKAAEKDDSLKAQATAAERASRKATKAAEIAGLEGESKADAVADAIEAHDAAFEELDKAEARAKAAAAKRAKKSKGKK